MSEDEILVAIVSSVIALILWGQWFYSCVSIEDFGRNRSLRYLALAAPCCAIALLFFMLRIYASADVRNDPAYLIMYTMMGAAWLAGLIPGAGFLGLSFRDDWLERGNSAAAAAGTGGLIGGIFAFAGANIGDGPGWWVVLFCALLATSAFFLCWWAYESLSDTIERIVLERELGTGIRLGGFLVTAGVMAGRAVAGDWKGMEPAIWDFVYLAWPLLPYTLGAGLVESSQRQSVRAASTSYSLCWLAFHLGLAILYLYWAGPWK